MKKIYEYFCTDQSHWELWDFQSITEPNIKIKNIPSDMTWHDMKTQQSANQRYHFNLTQLHTEPFVCEQTSLPTQKSPVPLLCDAGSQQMFINNTGVNTIFTPFTVVQPLLSCLCLPFHNIHPITAWAPFPIHKFAFHRFSLLSSLLESTTPASSSCEMLCQAMLHTWIMWPVESEWVSEREREQVKRQQWLYVLSHCKCCTVPGEARVSSAAASGLHWWTA